MLFVAISSGGGTINISGTCGDAGGSQIDAEVMASGGGTSNQTTPSSQTTGAFDFSPIAAPAGGSPYRVKVTVRATTEESVNEGVWVLGFGKKGRPKEALTHPDLYVSGITTSANEAVKIHFQSSNPKENDITSGADKKFPKTADTAKARHNKATGRNNVHIKPTLGRPFNKNFPRP